LEATRLKLDIEAADKLTVELEKLIQSRIPHSKTHKAPKSVSFLDIGIEKVDQNDAPQSEINSDNLPSIESLRKKLSDNEPQF